jgi:hypothetical protein
MRQSRQVVKSGQITWGVVFDRCTESDSDSTSHLIAFAFQVYHPGKGRQWITRAEDNDKTHKELRIGKAVRVSYLPLDPKVCQLVECPG